jgi:hypothetical protein
LQQDSNVIRERFTVIKQQAHARPSEQQKAAVRVKNPNTPVIQPSTKVMNKSTEQPRAADAAAESSKVGTGKFFVPSSVSNGKVNATACTTSTTRLTDQLQRPPAHAPPESEVIKTVGFS